MNEVEKAIDLYERNRSRLSLALEAAGCSAEVIMADSAYRKVLINLATNNIHIETTYNKENYDE